jgi:dynein intermediate chain 1
VDWNHNHTHTFISCSADFTVKLWHVDKPNPVMNFTLDGSVVDVRWSPLSSLIFAAIDNTGYIYFFNLKQNENKQVHQDNYINTVKSSQGGGQREIHLTRLSFNEEYKIMLVSDDSGGLNVYLPHPKLLVTGDDDESQKKKKGEGEEKEKLD